MTADEDLEDGKGRSGPDLGIRRLCDLLPTSFISPFCSTGQNPVITHLQALFGALHQRLHVVEVYMETEYQIQKYHINVFLNISALISSLT